MTTISGDNVYNAVISLIRNITPDSYPTKRFNLIDLGRDGRPQRHEDRMFALTWVTEVESQYCLGARQLQLNLAINYYNNITKSDINIIKQSLLTWQYDGIIIADADSP